MNYFKTAILLAMMTALFTGIGFFIGGQTGMLIAFVIAVGMNFFSAIGMPTRCVLENARCARGR